MTIAALVANQFVGHDFERAYYAPETLQDALTYARVSQDIGEQLRLHTLIATAESRFDFSDPNLNGLVNIQPMRFANWLQARWAGP